MSTYELDDALVRDWVATAQALGTTMDGPLADALAAQLPIPVPTKLGAVVRCDVGLNAPDPTVFVRYTRPDLPGNLYPWLEAGRMGPVYSDSEIGRITEVLFEGVETD